MPTHALIDLGEGKTAHPDRFYLPHTISVKQGVVKNGVKNKIYPFGFFLLVSIPLFFASLLLLSTHFFLVISSIELCINSPLGFVYSFYLKNRMGFLSILCLLNSDFLAGLFIEKDGTRYWQWQLGKKTTALAVA